jgi:HEAT repeat protein
LLDALADKHVDVRAQAATALGEIGPAARAACQPLVKALADPGLDVRAHAAQALRRLGPVVVKPLADALSDPQPGVRQRAAQALGLLGKDAKPAVPRLIEAVKNDHIGLRLAAIAALGAIGPEAKDSLPTLVQALQMQHLETQLQAYSAILLISIDDPATMAAILREVNQKARWATPYLLAQFGPKPEHAVKPLMLQLQDPDPNVRAAAALALGQLEPATAPEAIPALFKLLKDPVPPVRLCAAVALSRLDEKQRKATFDAIAAAPPMVLQAYQASQVRLAVLNGNAPVLNPAALTDPILQSQYDFIVNTFIASMLVKPSCKAECELVNPTLTALQNAVNKLGPAAVPALVRGFNLAARYNLGFT